MACDKGVPKLSVKDTPIAVAKKSHGSTTVAGTVHLAARAGIKLFVTGGLGGGHRGARESWGVSAGRRRLPTDRLSEKIWSQRFRSGGDRPDTQGEQLDPEPRTRSLGEGLDEVRRRGIRGKNVTPFLLDHFRREAGGERLRVNERMVWTTPLSGPGSMWPSATPRRASHFECSLILQGLRPVSGLKKRPTGWLPSGFWIQPA
jgi:hypothetical protein